MPLVPVLQELEDVLGLVRQGNIEFNAKIGDLSLLLLDHVRNFLNDSVHQTRVLYDADLYEQVGSQINQIAGHPDPEQLIVRAISLLDPKTQINKKNARANAQQPLHHKITEHYPELSYFAQLVPIVEARVPKWQGRISRLLSLAQRLLHVQKQPFAFEQLAAAIYVHDIAMSFLPLQLLNHAQPMSSDEKKQVQAHVYACSFLLSQSEHWQEASRILHEHHEWVNGAGYPKGLLEEEVHPGALCLSVLHAFESITHGHYCQEEYKRPVKRAMAELSRQSGSQFSVYWVQQLLNVVHVH